MASIIRDSLAPAGSTGNNTHPSVSVSPHVDQVGVEFKVTAVGAGPTVTFKVQGSMDDQSVPDSSSDWFDIAMQPSDTAGATEVTSVTKTAVGVSEYFIRLEQRFASKFRLVTSANTNVTYQADAHVRDVH